MSEEQASVSAPSSPQTIEQRIAAVIAPEQPKEQAPEPAKAEAPQAPEAPRAESPEPEQAEAPEQDAEDYIEIADLHGLAEHLGVDPADLYNIAVPYTKDGEKHEFTLGDIKDKYQQFEEAQTVREQAQRQLDTYREAEQRYVTAIQEQTQQAAAYLQNVERLAMQPFQNVNWAQLEISNPAEHIRLSRAYQQTQAQLAQAKQAAAQNIAAQKQQWDTQQQTIRAERLAREQQALMKAIPEWRDPKVADAERLELSEFMLALGYTADEINNVDDHRALLVVRDAMRFRKAKTSGDAAAKKVVKLAKKLVKPGTRTTDPAQTQAARAVKAHRADPRNMGAAAERVKLLLGRK